MEKTAHYHVVDFTEIPGVPCPCGSAKRGFAEVAAAPGTIPKSPAMPKLTTTKN